MGSPVTLQLLLDDYCRETRWTMKDSQDSIWYAGGPMIASLMEVEIKLMTRLFKTSISMLMNVTPLNSSMIMVME